jgi:HAD superfamily hydrolase (TIGR01549 family)
MALGAMIFDIDGTLIDSNPAHVKAWVQALGRLGYKVAADRVSVEIGKGGDKLVPGILGASADRRDGDRLRDAQKEEFLALAKRTRLPDIPGARELLAEWRRRGIRTALATSSSGEQLDGLFASAGIDFRELVDQTTSADDAAASKPSPDIVEAALGKLGLAPGECAMVGDTVYDAEACRAAGVACLGVRSGGNDPATLMRAGARGVWRDTADLLQHLDQALDIASPGQARLDQALTERLMRDALAVATAGLEAGDLPSGCVVARGDGTVIARACNGVYTRGGRTPLGALTALGEAASAIRADARDLILVATVEPCVMCLGAAMETAVDAVIFGARAPNDSGSERVQAPQSPGSSMPRLIGGVLAAESRALLARWLRTNPDSGQRPYVEQLLRRPA